MKVVVVNGQNHKGSTWHIGKMLADKLAEGDEIQEIFLPRDMPKFCVGCTNCFMRDEKLCPHHELMEPITRRLDEAEVMIFTTPVYVYHATASMKALLDHYGYRWMLHRPEPKMFHKQAVCVSTAAGGGMKSACKDIRDSLFFWGVPKVYTLGTAVMATSWKGISNKKKREIASRVSHLADKILAHNGKVHPGWKTKALFEGVRLLQRSGWNPADLEYWKKRGWDQKIRPWHGR